MMGRTALMFPGLGSYFPAAFSACPQGRRIVEEVAAQVDSASRPYGLPSMTPALLHAPAAGGQPPGEDLMVLAVFAAEVICHRLLAQSGSLAADVLFGHSLGEYAALVAAGGLSVTDGATLLCERGATLRRHAIPAGAMLALSLTPRQARQQVAAYGQTVIAAINGPEQVVLSGPAEEIDRLLRDSDGQVGPAKRLRTGAYPQHHPLLARAYQDYLQSLGSIKPKPLSCLVYSPVLGRYYLGCDDLALSLALQMILPVDFLSAVRELHASGVRTFVECGLKRTLCDLVEAAVPSAQAIAPFRTRTTPAHIRATLGMPGRP
ncbi:acyltransferase domain-containing protein [Nonomuraea sp. NPDC005692]|uniref:ACP S-malonyltransferase n=1 Tax=Nonomuraea sp. NPDC005692 TaxID=3157168 RepID=UPI00340F21EE